ncbi:heavy metal translocating P-type ATPase, partial [Actinotalea sp. C106]|uniref:heavy metal translocating P-type ATPase n=1 Tax=Actinotalea sp. C106 TaxID=2908644 RepID=UPI0035ABFEF4
MTDQNPAGTPAPGTGTTAPGTATTPSPHEQTTAPVAVLDLAVSGMTCASCVARVEKKIGKVPGATATVNLATETAQVHVSDDVDAASVVKAVQAAGYSATVLRDSRAVARAKAAREAATEHGAGDAGAHDGHDMTLSGHSMAEGHEMDPDEDTSAPERDRGEDLRRRLIVASILTLPVLVLSMVPPLQFPGWQWVVTALALPVVTWAAWPFHRAAVRAARHGSSTMDTLVSLGITAASLWSVWAVTLGGAGEIGMRMEPVLIPRLGAGEMHMPEIYFEVAAVVATFLLAGRYAEHRSRRQAGDALRTLLSLGATQATLLVDDGGRRTEREVPVEDLREGDLFAVRPGEKVATDGVVVEGTSAVDTSLLTGEPVPVDVEPGSQVTGATINTSGWLAVRATRVGEETMLAQIGRLVAQAQTGKAPIQRLADRISAVFVPIVNVLAVGTFVVWLLVGGGVQAAFTAAVAVLIIACPCALGLATPTALLVGTGRGAQLGILIKGPEILESTRRVDTVVLDKTGTVTEGRMELVEVLTAEGVEREELLRFAGAVEGRSEHPIARAIAAGARDTPTTGGAPEPGSPTRDDVAAGADAVAMGSDQVVAFLNGPARGVSGVVRTAH